MGKLSGFCSDTSICVLIHIAYNDMTLKAAKVSAKLFTWKDTCRLTERHRDRQTYMHSYIHREYQILVLIQLNAVEDVPTAQDKYQLMYFSFK